MILTPSFTPSKFSIKDHLLQPAEFLASPHQRARPNGEISLIVLHSASLPHGEYGTDYLCQLFTGELDCAAHSSFAKLQDLEVSAHLFIRRDGKVIQFVPFDLAAWHAGVSEYEGRSDCNDFSIGIELEGSKNDAYEEVQYETLAEVCQTLCDAYAELDPAKIVGHIDIAHGRKDDPWNFDWDRFRRSRKLRK